MENDGIVIDRLLKSQEPSIRWKTRVHVLGESQSGRGVRRLQREIRDSPRVDALLAGRRRDGRLIHGRNVYDKWRGAHWVLATLADIGYPRGDSSLRQVAEGKFFGGYPAERPRGRHGDRGGPG